jgi:hypothetical protein
MKLTILERKPDGKLNPVNGLVWPSLPCPEISVERFEIENLRQPPGDDSSYVCDISVTGTVQSAICDVIPGKAGTIGEVRFVHNDSEDPVGSFPVDVSKADRGYPSAPFLFRGAFSFTAKAVPVTEGNNTFRITARDQVYGLDGHSLWAASFAFPFVEDYEPEDEDSVEEPTVIEGPQLLEGGGKGEISTYCFSLASGEREAEGYRLVVGGPHGASFPFISVPGAEGLVAVWPDTAVPALFTLRPTMAIEAKVPTNQKMLAAMGASPALPEKTRFVQGFCQGLGFEGYDLVFDPQRIAIGAVRISPDRRGLLFSIGLADTAGKAISGEAMVAPGGTSSVAVPDSPSAMPNMMFHFADLFRKGDPRAQEVVMSLLVGDLSEVGIEDVSLADWRGYFYMCFSEMLETLIQNTLSHSEVAQGYYIGRLVADALRPHVDPKLPDRLSEAGKAAFLLRLAEMPALDDGVRATMATKGGSGLMGGLKRFFGGR